MVSLLERLGHNVHYNPNQTCCGRLCYERGYGEEARQLSLKFLDDLNTNNPVVSPSSACITFLRKYIRSIGNKSVKRAIGSRLERSSYEFSDFVLNQLKVERFDSKFSGRAVFLDDSDALLKLGIREEPRKLLKAVPGLELLELPDFVQPYAVDLGFTNHHGKISAAIDEELVKEIEKLGGVTHIISTETVSLMHLQSYLDKKGSKLKTIHLIDVLSA